MCVTNTGFNLGKLANNEMCIIFFSLKEINQLRHYERICKIVKIKIDDIDFTNGRVNYTADNEQTLEGYEEDIHVNGHLPNLPTIVLFAGNKPGNTLCHFMYDLIKLDEYRNLSRYCASATINTNHYCMIFVKINNLYYTFDGCYATMNNDIQTCVLNGVI